MFNSLQSGRDGIGAGFDGARAPRVAILGGGPAGSFCAIWLSALAARRGRRFDITLFDHKSFEKPGPAGCNMCAGIIPDSLVRNMRHLGMELPRHVIQRRIAGYRLETKGGFVDIPTPPGVELYSTFRGPGPLGMYPSAQEGFDYFLLHEAEERGIRYVNALVTDVTLPPSPSEPCVITCRDGGPYEADILVGAFGVNSNLTRIFEGLGFGYRGPEVARAFQAEIPVDPDFIAREMRDRVFIFTGVPHLKFAAMTPKREHVTVTLIGADPKRWDLEQFLSSPEVRRRMPAGWEAPCRFCSCAPRLPLTAARHAVHDRIVIIGDAHVARYLKNGIESSFHTACWAARAIAAGHLSAESLAREYVSRCQYYVRDNRYGRALFELHDAISASPTIARAHIEVARREQASPRRPQRLSTILWGMFTGNIPYRSIAMRLLDPRVHWDIAQALARGALVRDRTQSLRGKWGQAPATAAQGLPQTRGAGASPRGNGDRHPFEFLRVNPFDYVSGQAPRRWRRDRRRLEGREPVPAARAGQEASSAEEWGQAPASMAQGLLQTYGAGASPPGREPVPAGRAGQEASSWPTERGALGPLGPEHTVIIVGGGPAGAACAIALAREGERLRRVPRIILVEEKRFGEHQNQCAGVISPPGLEMIADGLGVRLPEDLIQREIRGYVLHANGDAITLDGDELGERATALRRVQLDRVLLEAARHAGAQVVQARAEDLEVNDDGVIVYTDSGTFHGDVVVGAFGLDPGIAQAFARATPYRRPASLETLACKLHPAGLDFIPDLLGGQIHVFLPPERRIEFGAMIPKGNHVTVIVAGRRLHEADMTAFLTQCAARLLPPACDIQGAFKGSFPLGPARHLYGDRYVVLGDAAGLVRPFKGKGINAGIEAGWLAARTMLTRGISREAFDEFARSRRHLIGDLHYGRLVRWLTGLVSRWRLLPPFLAQARRDGELRQELFDCVSGRTTYREVVRRRCNRRLIPLMVWRCARYVLRGRNRRGDKEEQAKQALPLKP